MKRFDNYTLLTIWMAGAWLAVGTIGVVLAYQIARV
jgi:hypothetical protein